MYAEYSIEQVANRLKILTKGRVFLPCSLNVLQQKSRALSSLSLRHVINDQKRLQKKKQFTDMLIGVELRALAVLRAGTRGNSLASKRREPLFSLSTASFYSETGLDEVCHVHRHLLDLSGVELLNITEVPHITLQPQAIRTVAGKGVTCQTRKGSSVAIKQRNSEDRNALKKNKKTTDAKTKRRHARGSPNCFVTGSNNEMYLLPVELSLGRDKR